MPPTSKVSRRRGSKACVLGARLAREALFSRGSSVALPCMRALRAVKHPTCRAVGMVRPLHRGSRTRSVMTGLATVAFFLLLWVSLLYVPFRWRPVGIFLISEKALAAAYLPHTDHVFDLVGTRWSPAARVAVHVLERFLAAIPRHRYACPGEG